ncbi:hypothetical protein [Magnetospirillum sp. SS-4]|uniref:hypothetical protein n=1 Tax=Magnetospirillum sp. SS-4 TaxID=2681465 RepID=UPI00138087A7|nr:hypothetical protein [Magnetospirillum sp. SS-4]CAA7624205.1 hypothetical protein MTBSS4_440024 [Magnetospirillum sp. SS-4]
MENALPTLVDLRRTLRRNGYHPVPISGPHLSIKAAGKRPLMRGWVPAPDHPTFAVTPEMIEPAMRWPAALKRENLLGTATMA